LRDAGHDVKTAAELGLAQAEDLQLLQTAQSIRRILLTRDRDFGQLVFIANAGGGVIYLRMLPEEQQAVHAELINVLNKSTEVSWFSVKWNFRGEPLAG